MILASGQKENETAPLAKLAVELGQGLRNARKSKGQSQAWLAALAGIEVATVQQLERGRGTVRPLVAVMAALEIAFTDQPEGLSVGEWMTSARTRAKLTQQSLATSIGVSKPTVGQIEHGRGQIANLLRAVHALGLSVAFRPTSRPFRDVRLMLGDCLELLPTVDEGTVRVAICDLPYLSTELPWDQEEIALAPLWAELRRVLKPDGAVVLTASQPFSAKLVMSNPEWFKYAMVWEKSRPTGFLHSKHMPLKKHEDILVFSPGSVVGRHKSNRTMVYNPQGLIETSSPGRPPKQRRFAGRKIAESPVQSHTNYPTSILRFPSEHAPIHEAQKPLELFRYLVRTFSHPGDTVLDCCFGSGTTAVAAVLEGRTFVGMEKDARYFEAATRRVGALPF